MKRRPTKSADQRRLQKEANEILDQWVSTTESGRTGDRGEYDPPPGRLDFERNRLAGLLPSAGPGTGQTPSTHAPKVTTTKIFVVPVHMSTPIVTSDPSTLIGAWRKVK